MQQKTTYKELRSIEANMRALQQNPALQLLLAKGMRDFYNKNTQRLDIMQKTLVGNIKKYVKHDDKGEPVTEKNDKEQELYVFNDPESEVKYVAEMEAFWDLSFTIEI